MVTVSVSPLATRVSMRNMEAVDDACHSAIGCGGVDASTVAMVLLTGVLALLVLAAIVQVREAISIVDDERERITAERDAFDAFSRRIANLEVTEAAAAVPASGGIVTAASAAPDDRLERVQVAYRDTVMDVPHYESDYGEPLAENLAAEFNDGLAVAITDGHQFTPQLKAALLQASREASRNRTTFLSTLDAEADALSEAAATVETIDGERESIAAAPFPSRSYEELVRDWHRLGELANRCRDLLQSRQEQVRSGAAKSLGSTPDLHEYLYEDLPVSHPVLADLASLSEELSSLRSRVLRSVTRRV